MRMLGPHVGGLRYPTLVEEGNLWKLEGKLGKKKLKRTISASGRFGLLHVTSHTKQYELSIHSNFSNLAFRNLNVDRVSAVGYKNRDSRVERSSLSSRSSSFMA